MFIIDDPMLALIVRFVAGNREIGVSDDEFMRRQIQAVGEYIGRFPEQERETRALEWIEKNAECYRRNWQRAVIAEKLTDTRCPDCPLEREDKSSYCEVHGGWLAILKRYMEDKISSALYVENTLNLLETHKTRLKVARFGEKS